MPTQAGFGAPRRRHGADRGHARQLQVKDVDFAFGVCRVEWPGDPGVEFHLSHGDWIRLLRRSGFEIEHLVEVRPLADATTRYPFVTLEWAREWPRAKSSHLGRPPVVPIASSPGAAPRGMRLLSPAEREAVRHRAIER